MTALYLLALAGYFLILFEYIALCHRDICAESDARMCDQLGGILYARYPDMLRVFPEATLYWNRGTK